jgi:hypothetical protein
MTKVTKKFGKHVKPRKTSGGADVLGVTNDGVRILKPKGRATHFTRKELRATVATVRAAKQA